MQWRNSDARYGAVTIAFHWLAATAILALLATGVMLWRYPEGPAHIPWVRAHIAIGVVIWPIVAFRAIWHFIERRPRPLADAPALNRLASIVHVTLLILVAVQLITGPINVWSGGFPVGIYDWLTVPNPMPGQLRAQHDAIGEFHVLIGRIIAALVALHLCGVAKHVLIDRDGTLGRMLGRGAAVAQDEPEQN